MKELEIEKRFLAKPDIMKLVQGNTPQHVDDVYVPETTKGHPTLRIRNKDGKYTITKKTPVSEADKTIMEEVTIPLSQDEYEALRKSSRAELVKDRYIVKIDGRNAEVDVYKNKLAGLIFVEFEFDNEEDLETFKKPDFLGIDATNIEFLAGGMMAGKDYDYIAEKISSM